MVIAAINTVACHPPRQAQFSSARGSIENQLTVAANVVGKKSMHQCRHNMMQHSGKSYEDIICAIIALHLSRGIKHRLEETVMGLYCSRRI